MLPQCSGTGSPGCRLPCESPIGRVCSIAVESRPESRLAIVRGKDRIAMSLLPWLFTAILCFAEPLAARSAHAIQLEPEPISEESPFALAADRIRS